MGREYSDDGWGSPPPKEVRPPPPSIPQPEPKIVVNPPLPPQQLGPSSTNIDPKSSYGGPGQASSYRRPSAASDNRSDQSAGTASDRRTAFGGVKKIYTPSGGGSSSKGLSSGTERARSESVASGRVLTHEREFTSSTIGDEFNPDAVPPNFIAGSDETGTAYPNDGSSTTTGNGFGAVAPSNDAVRKVIKGFGFCESHRGQSAVGSAEQAVVPKRVSKLVKDSSSSVRSSSEQSDVVERTVPVRSGGFGGSARAPSVISLDTHSTRSTATREGPGAGDGLGFGQPVRKTTFGGRDGGAGSGKPAQTYIPKKEKVDLLYKQKVCPGIMFDQFFDAPTDTMQSGLHTLTKEQTYFRSFDDLHLSELVRNNVVNRCEYDRPTPVQQCTATRIFNGDDMLVCAQTGTGKTAAFLLPIFSDLLHSANIASCKDRACYPRCLIVAPTRELAVQIQKEGQKFSYGSALDVKCIYGGTCVAHQKREVLERTSILVATTGRLLHFLDDGIVRLDRLKYLVIDEADRMLDMGFGPDIEAILTNETMPKLRQTLMFSATFPVAVQKIAQDHLRPNYSMVTVDKIGIANKCIHQTIIQCDRSEKKNRLFELLTIDLQTYTTEKDSDIFNQKTIIFVSKKTFADALGLMLCEANIPSTTIHGDREQEEREEALRDFYTGRKAILVATGVAERGLDICGLDHVINYDLPNDIDTYIHRIGRTGRVGNPGRATSFFTVQDMPLAEGLIRCLLDAGQDVPEFLHHVAGASRPPSVVQSSEEEW